MWVSHSLNITLPSDFFQSFLLFPRLVRTNAVHANNPFLVLFLAHQHVLKMQMLQQTRLLLVCMLACMCIKLIQNQEK